MLHAINRKKARMDAFRGPGQRVPLEDVVTSTLLGPLLFIDQNEAAAAAERILTSLTITPPAWSGPSHLSLWPKRNTADDLRRNYIEPDGEITDVVGNSLIIEVKWGAPLSPFELAAQWLSLSPEQRTTSRHLLIALEIGPYRADIDRDRRLIASRCDIPWAFHAVTWRRMADAFRAIARDVDLNSGTRRWAQAAHGFLRREDPRSLAGWDNLELAPVLEEDWSFRRQLLTKPVLVEHVSWSFRDGWFSNREIAHGATAWSFES